MKNTIDQVRSVRRIALSRKGILTATNLHDALAVPSATYVNDVLFRKSERWVEGAEITLSPIRMMKWKPYCEPAVYQ